MKKLLSIFFQPRAALAAGFMALACPSAFALTFTNNAHIGSANTNYDGLDITISNCTLVVDGSHALNSLHVAAGGVLTHSFATNGAVSNIYYLTNEAQVLYGTTPVTLLNSNVITSTVIVTAYGTTNAYTNGQDYLLTSPDGIVTQLQRTTNSTIPDGGIVLVSYEGFGATQGTVPAGLNLTVSGNVQVDAGGFIFADGLGFDIAGVGAGSTGGGGSYGGVGGFSLTGGHGGTTFGLYNGQPSLGYGGGNGLLGPSAPGGAGGGLIQINSGGSVILNGVVTANGANGTNDQSGGGSGGGIFITANVLSGTGAISVNGGAGEPAYAGGGGGGRISLQYNATSFTGSMTAIGGIGYTAGSPGSIYTKLAGQNGLVLYDNAGRHSGTNSTITLQSSSTDLLIRSNASVTPSPAMTVGNLTVASNGFLVALGSSPQGPQVMSMTVFGALTVKAGGAIVADGLGYGQGSGTSPGHGINDNFLRPCGGGGYGGYGASSPSNSAASGGSTYGTQSSPLAYGSGGGNVLPYSVGGAGGGDIQINSENGIVQVDGVISANGLNGSGTGGGGGAGGTVWISGGTLVGSGSITANGGSGAIGVGGGGGGGRVDINPAANLFAGTISAYGGDGGGRGGAGTVLIQVSGQNIQLIVDNGGHFGTNTVVQGANGTDLIVRGGGVACASQTGSFINLYIYSNGWIYPLYSIPTQPLAINFSFTGNATIQAGGGIIADSGGSQPGNGINNGAGRTGELGSTNLCSGGGHGGPGGNSFGNVALGGSTYDSYNEPASLGSGGGTSTPLSPGGYGGGLITLTVAGTLEVDGIISANGGNGTGLAGGGGAGGGIRLNAGIVAGVGSITANGGSGANGLGGGGGGGIIAIPSENSSFNFFSGTVTAYGGSGANPGGTGTIFIPEGGQRFQVILDAGGNPGPASPLSASGSATDVLIRNGGKGITGGFLTLGNIVIGSNSTLLASNVTLTCTTLTVQASGSILSDALYSFGSAVGGALGAPTYACGGGGNGGPGGNSVSNLAAGGVNLLYYQAAQGSAGGSEPPYSIGGLGGGSPSITSSGLMQIDGIISASGGNGSGIGGGGGAGGALLLTCGSIGGAGTIRANGGAGVDSIGGGGGGGTVLLTINNTVNQFAGLISAYGGSGAHWGGPGQVTIKQSGQTPQLILDAGNNPVTPTSINSSTTENLTLRNGAAGIITGDPAELFSNLLIASNSWLYVSNGSLAGPTLNCSSATIQAGGGISADFNGYAPGEGTGAGHSVSFLPYYASGGGAHGGVGGNSISNVAAGGLPYDSQTSPISSGSGGGTASPGSLGGAGGGAFNLIVTGLLQVDGAISANGGNGSGAGGGGGAGGGIKLTAGSLAGIGSIRANGGSGVGSIGGGGSGGIIALNLATNSFIGNISAWGGSGAVAGGAGTVYLQSGSPAVINGQLTVDNNGQSGAFTPLQSFSSQVSVLLRNGAFAYQQSPSATFGSILIASNGWLTAYTNSSGQTQVNLSITGNATVEAGGGIIANGTGSPGGSGVGAGHATTGSVYFPGGGGGNGGNGGSGLSNFVAGGAVYGSITEPTAPGSSSGVGSGGGNVSPNSPGGAGGGGIRLNVTGTFDVSGTVSANGNNGGGLGGGGGSGGDIWVTVGTLTGVGTIAANGGNGAEGNGGGGGGGRIAIAYNNSSSFVGLVAAHGGIGFMNGGAGTIYTAASKVSAAQVLADNGGIIGTNTPLATSLGTPTGPFNLAIQNGAAVVPLSNPAFPTGPFPELSNLTVASGGLLTGLPGSTFDVLVLGNADIQAGGALAADGEGYSEGGGPGAGRSASFSGSGAGYGGAGGASAAVAGGSSYGSATQPVDFGSGGGPGNQGSPFGSAGGGALRLNVGGILTVDGSMTSEGQAALGDSSGGGSGGSIWVTAGMLAGAGDVAADGGEGQLYYGGGGAGGRIALYCRTNVFGGATSVAGAAGYASGGNGTIVISNNVAPLVVLSSTPTGTISNSVSTATINFSGAPNPATLSFTSVSIVTPNGPLSGGLSFTMLNSSTYQVAFPAQTTPGNYALIVNQGVKDLYGQPLSQTYTQVFSVSLPVIQGTITDTMGNPLAGVTLQNSAGFTTVTTDTNGNYTLGFLPGISFTVTPVFANYTFNPPTQTYTTTTSVTGQNYTGTSTLAPSLATAVSGNSLAINWQGVAGVNYHIYTSSNLVNWVPCGICYAGSNGPAQCLMPIATNGMQFFTVQPGN